MQINALSSDLASILSGWFPASCKALEVLLCGWFPPLANLVDFIQVWSPYVLLTLEKRSVLKPLSREVLQIFIFISEFPPDLIIIAIVLVLLFEGFFCSSDVCSINTICKKSFWSDSGYPLLLLKVV